MILLVLVTEALAPAVAAETVLRAAELQPDTAEIVARTERADARAGLRMEMPLGFWASRNTPAF